MGDRGKDSMPPKLTLTSGDLVAGRSFTTLRSGHEPETVVFECTGMGRDRRGNERFEVRLFNPDTGKTVVTALDRFKNGRIGKSRVIEAAPIESSVDSDVEVDLARSQNPFPELGTDMIMVVPKDNPGDEFFTIVSRVEDGSAILTSPDSSGRQMLRVPKEELLSGEMGAFNFQYVDPKFSLLKEDPNKVIALKETTEEVDEPRLTTVEGIASRDVRGGEIIGGLLPSRTLEERLSSPDGVLVEAIDAAARQILSACEGKVGSVKAQLAFLWAFKGGFLARLPLVRRGA